MLHADAAHYEAHLAENLAELRSRVRSDAAYTHVLALATAFIKNSAAW